MGITESVENENIVSFKASKIAKSLYPVVVSLHLDPEQLPISGIICVGKSCKSNTPFFANKPSFFRRRKLRRERR